MGSVRKIRKFKLMCQLLDLKDQDWAQEWALELHESLGPHVGYTCPVCNPDRLLS